MGRLSTYGFPNCSYPLTFDIKYDVFGCEALRARHFAQVAARVARLHVHYLQLVVLGFDGGRGKITAVATPLDPTGRAGRQVTGQLYGATNLDVFVSLASAGHHTFLCMCGRGWGPIQRETSIYHAKIHLPNRNLIWWE